MERHGSARQLYLIHKGRRVIYNWRMAKLAADIIMTSEDDLEYDADLVDGLELIWGEGFLSPGGPSEVAQILGDISVEGKHALDIGCGLGGPSCALVEHHNAAQVVAIDIEKPVIQKARDHAAARNLGERIDFRVVTPGQLPFDDNSFDLVFSKDAFVHVEHKEALFRECYRVLREGGWFACSDWFRGEKTFSPEMDDWLAREAQYVTFHMVTLNSMASIFGNVGFGDVTSIDRNDWYKEYAREELARLSGPVWNKFVERFGQQEAEDWLDGIRRRMEVVDQGHLRPGHVKGQKPQVA